MNAKSSGEFEMLAQMADVSPAKTLKGCPKEKL